MLEQSAKRVAFTITTAGKKYKHVTFCFEEKDETEKMDLLQSVGKNHFSLLFHLNFILL